MASHHHHHHHHHLHFLIIPLMSQSHLIPMTDFSKLLAHRGVTVTIITTPLNSARFEPIVDRAAKTGLKIQLLPLYFPCKEVGLPEGCENMDTLSSPDLTEPFFRACEMLLEPLENLIDKVLVPKPSCIITSNALTWTSKISKKFNIPRYIFDAISCFTLLCSHNLSLRKSEDKDKELVLVPDMPQKIQFNKAQLPDHMTRNSKNKLSGLMDQIRESRLSAQGALVNTFEEMEHGFVEEYKKVRQKTWCIGPVSLCNKEVSDKFSRGNKASIDENLCLKWLESKETNSVIYACFGSLCHISLPQLIEIGLGLEASNRPFVWIIRGSNCSGALDKWLAEEKFEERNREKGLVVRGWAPQVLILSHRAVGGFLTHCGWNSTLEGVCAGVPMITWPMFAEQFYNEKVVTSVLRIGVRIGVEVGMQWEEEEEEEEKEGGRVLAVKREQVKKAVDLLMSDGEEGGERRKRARELGEMAKKAIEEGGSSYLNMTLLIEDVIQQVNPRASLTKEHSIS